MTEKESMGLHCTSQIDWIPVAERLPVEQDEQPPNYGRYLVASPGGIFMARRERTIEEGAVWVDVAAYRHGGDEAIRYILHGITHWAELPVLSLIAGT